MNKKTLKGILAGTLAGVITVCSVPVIAEGIEAVINSVNIKLDGENVAKINENYTLQNGTKVPFSILYEGTTYLPIRKISELLDVGIDWDNDTRTVVIESNPTAVSASENYDAWYGVPDFGAVSGIKELDNTATVHSTTHWYEVNDVKDEAVDTYVAKLEQLGFERVTTGGIKPKFKVYKKGNIEVWMDLGMYKKLVYGVTVMDVTRPLCSREYEYSGTREDIPNFGSAFGYSSKVVDGKHYIIGEWDMWACLPDYLCILEEEGFKITDSDSGYYGKSLTIKKDRSTLSLKFDGSEFSNIPAVVFDY